MNGYCRLLLLLAVLFQFQSCTIEKRRYVSGYHIEWNSGHPKIRVAELDYSEIKINREWDIRASGSCDNSFGDSCSNGKHPVAPTHFQDTLQVRAHTTLRTVKTGGLLASKQKSVSAVKRAAITQSNADCDLMVLQSGEELLAKVIEVGSTDIKYRKCSTDTSIIYLIPRNSVFMIKYEDGRKEVVTPFEKTEEKVYVEGPKRGNGTISILSFCMSMIGLVYLTGFLAPIGLILGIVALATNDKYTGLAAAGVAIGLLEFFLWIVLLANL